MGKTRTAGRQSDSHKCSFPPKRDPDSPALRTMTPHGTENVPHGPDPVTTPADADPGADTSGRFRYQAGYAALLAVGMLDEAPGVSAVYCEHHDDVLLELDDGRCDAIQVKSQADGVAPLKRDGRAGASGVEKLRRPRTRLRGSLPPLPPGQHLRLLPAGNWSDELAALP